MAEYPTPELLSKGPADSERTLVLAHGAGAPMDSDFMEQMAGAVAEAGIRVVRFEFPYMAECRRTDKRRPPNSLGTLLESWRQVVQALGDPRRLVVGGKSMGGRMATMVADELGVTGLVCLGYPFHPVGMAERSAARCPARRQ